MNSSFACRSACDGLPDRVTLVAKSSCELQASVARDGVTVPHDAPLPAGKYTVTLTGKTPSGEL
jgi:hypothetical protein